MKKYLKYLLQLLILFLFFVLIVAIFGLIKEIYQSKEGLAYGFTYGIGGTMVLVLFFWMNIKLWKFSNKNDKTR